MDEVCRTQFDSLDQTADPREFVRYLDATRATDFVQEVKRRMLALMELRAGDSAADMGCGTSEDVHALAAQISPSGRAFGVDLSGTMIATAQQRSRDSASNIKLVQADVQRLPFKDGCFDAIRAERLLQHTPDVDAALREIVRLTRTGGRIVIWEGDLDLFVIDAPDYEASRIVQRVICDSFRNGGIGHQLYRRFLDHGLVDVQAIPLVGRFTSLALIESAFDLTASEERAVSQKLLDHERARNWHESLRSADRAGRFFWAVGGFIVLGRKG